MVFFTQKFLFNVIGFMLINSVDDVSYASYVNNFSVIIYFIP